MRVLANTLKLGHIEAVELNTRSQNTVKKSPPDKNTPASCYYLMKFSVFRRQRDFSFWDWRLDSITSLPLKVSIHTMRVYDNGSILGYDLIKPGVEKYPQ